MSDTQLVPIRVAARWLHVPADWLRDEADAGRVPCLRAGKIILCDVTAVERVLLNRARNITSTEAKDGRFLTDS